MASSGSFTTSSCEGRSLTFSWSIQSQSVANNTTTISWNLTGSGSYTYGWVTCGGFKVIINGSTVYNQSTDYRINVYSGTTVASGTHTIAHNGDGTKSFSASAQAGIYTYAVNCSGSGSWALTTIPRSSSITSATNITLGSKCGITFTPASTSFYYNIQFSLGSWVVDTGLFKPGQTTAYTYNYYTIPADSTLYAQIPNSTTATMTATLTTYSSNSKSALVGTSAQTFTVTVPSSVVPTIGDITLNPVDINSQDILVQSKNKLTISVSGCSAGSGSSIKSYTFSGPGISTTTTSTSVSSSGPISNTGTLTYTVTVTDNRGRTASATKTITCYQYAAPKFKSFTAYRVGSSSSTTKDENGAYIYCKYSVLYYSVNNTNSIASLNITGGTSTITHGSWTTSTSGQTITATRQSWINLNGNTTSTYKIYTTVKDKYHGTGVNSSTLTVFGASKVFNVLPQGNGIAFGKMAESDDTLDSKWSIKTDGSITATGAIDSDAKAQTMQNLSYRGQNLISSTTKDTVAEWNNQGNLATTFYTKTGQINNQPSQYGFLLNFSTGIGGKEMHNLWFTQPNGDVSHRGGNGDGLGGWRQFLDSSNYTNWVPSKPVSLYSSSTGNVGTVTLSQSAANFSYLEIFYTDNNGRQGNSVRIDSPNGKYVTLDCIEPSTTNTDPRVYLRTSGWTISGTSMTVGRSDLSGANRGVYGQMYPHANGTNIDVKVTANNYIKIVKVLGYK